MLCGMKGVKARGQEDSREGKSTLLHIHKLHILIEREVFVSQSRYSCFVDFKKSL